MTLAEAYRRTLFHAGPVAARPGQRSATGDAWLASLPAREASFITAWNPMSRRHPPGRNNQRQAALRASLRRHPMLEGTGGYRDWQEHHLLVVAPARRLLHVARHFRQAAILHLRHGRPAAIIWTARAARRC